MQPIIDIHVHIMPYGMMKPSAMELMKKGRGAIESGTFDELRKTFVSQYKARETEAAAEP